MPPADLRVEVQPLQGGLESSVLLARVHQHEQHASIPPQLVVKELRAGLAREADVYQLLWRHLDRPPAVQVLGHEVSPDATYLYLEQAQPCSAWPWSDTALSGAVCRELARLHDTRHLPRESFSWNYETELAESAQLTLQLAMDVRDASGQRYWRRLGDLRRIVAALPSIRHRFLSAGTTIIHGDVHPGNVILRDGETRADVVLIDWARARVGSPLEDVASWLHSLGCWEPQARRRHDTLMRAYLDALTVPRAFDSELRRHYWFASVSNGVSGAIRYHLAVLSDAATTDAARDNSRQALAAWHRVVRRAAALLSTSSGR